ncbi:hypothetical protein Tco_1172541 [Tanacetum coccineum]
MKDPECVKKRVKIAPHDYSKENYLATFTPQKQLTPEQIFWPNDLITMKSEALKEQTKASRPIKALMVYPLNTLATLVPRVLPTNSKVKIKIFALIHLFLEFEKTCKKRITPTGLTEGERGFEQTKACYLTEVIPFFKTLKEHFEGIQKALTKEVKEMKEIFEELEAEVDQNAVHRKHDEIEWKNLIIANDNLIVDCLSKDVFYIATNSELTVSRFTKMHDAHTVVQARCLELEEELSKLHDTVQEDDHTELVKRFSNLEVNHLNLQLKYQNLKESFGNNTSPPARDAPDFDSVFIIEKMKASIQGKDNAIKKLRMAENEKFKQHYKESYDSIKITHAKLVEQINAMLTKNENLKVQIQIKMKCVTKDHVIPKVLAPGSVETLREIVEEAKAATPLTRKKQVTFEDQCETSNSNAHKHVEQLKVQKTNVPVPPSIGGNSCTDASGSQPRSNTKKNRILPAKSVNKKKVEGHPRTNQSSLNTTNRVDSSISSKRTVINSNSHSICQTCNKCLIYANHDVCVVNYLHSLNASPSVKNVVHKVKQVWKPKQVKPVGKPKQVKQVWKPTGKILTNVGYQWMPTGRTFTLREQCHLTRLTNSKVVPTKQMEKVSSSKNVITRKLSHKSQKPLTRYQRKNQPYQAVPDSIPTPPKNQAFAYANQQDPNLN